MQVEREKFPKFLPCKLHYEAVPTTAITKEHYQRKISTVSVDTVADTGSTRRAIFHQITATCAVLLLAASCGMPIGYSAVLLPQLSMANTTEEIAIDVEIGSWIASVHSLATPFGSLLSGPLADHIGRRSTLLISVLPTFVGWSLVALSQSHITIILGRLLCGFAVGLLGGPGQVYIAETAEPNLRSLLIGAPYVAYSLGILIIYALGSALHWRTVAWCGNILPALSVLAILYIPESPVWLVHQKRLDKARDALIFLRGNSIAAEKEANELNARVQKEEAAPRAKENIVRLLCQRAAVKPLLIVVLLSLLQMFSGTFLVVFYAIDIISAFGSSLDTKGAAIWTALVRMICTMIICVLLLVVRRRRIILIASIGSGLSCLVLSVHMYAHNGGPKSNSDVLLTASCLLVYIVFNTALMVMPGIMVGELFPARIRGRTAGTVFAAMNVALFGLTKAFPFIHALMNIRGIFMMFAVASFAIAIAMFMLQPETKGRSLDQIEDYFNEDNWLWCNRSRKQISNNSENNSNSNSNDSRLIKI